jgi:hypothetical protein
MPMRIDAAVHHVGAPRTKPRRTNMTRISVKFLLGASTAAVIAAMSLAPAAYAQGQPGYMSPAPQGGPAGQPGYMVPAPQQNGYGPQQNAYLPPPENAPPQFPQPDGRYPGPKLN